MTGEQVFMALFLVGLAALWVWASARARTAAHEAAAERRRRIRRRLARARRCPTRTAARAPRTARHHGGAS